MFLNFHKLDFYPSYFHTLIKMPKPNRNCKICNKKFYAKPNWIKKGWGKYCSKKCQFEAQKNGKLVKCHICEKEVYRSQSSLEKSESGKYFCSKSCQTKWRNEEVFIGKNHSNWEHGKYTYKRKILKSDKERICKMCKENDKRLLVVHHIDQDRTNNELSNLVWLCYNCHQLVHHYDNEKKKLDNLLS